MGVLNWYDICPSALVETVSAIFSCVPRIGAAATDLVAATTLSTAEAWMTLLEQLGLTAGILKP